MRRAVTPNSNCNAPLDAYVPPADLIRPQSTWRAIPRSLKAMCNLYSVTKGQQAIREAAAAMRDLTGNLPSLRGVFPTTPRRSCAAGRMASAN